jgi:hypothetical protein
MVHIREEPHDHPCLLLVGVHEFIHLVSALPNSITHDEVSQMLGMTEERLSIINFAFLVRTPLELAPISLSILL